MGDIPPEGSESSENLGEEGLNQADLDALFSAASGDATPEGDETSAGEAATSAESAPTATAEEDITGSFNQADIDALLGGGGDDAVAVADADAADAAGEADQASGDADEPAAPDERLDTLGRPFDEAAAAMQAAIDEERLAAEAAKSEPTPLPPGAAPAELPSFDQPAATTTIDSKRVTMLNDVNLRVRVQLGKTKMLVEEILQLGEGSVVELDKLAGDPVDVLVNDRLVARGEVLVLNDNFCVRVSEVISNDPHRITV